MEESQIQQIIRTANQEGLGRANALTFLFIHGFGENSISKTQDDLSTASCVDPRTLRSHLYALNEEGWIDYTGGVTDTGSKNIILKRFRH